jgi:hypothetical protein
MVESANRSLSADNTLGSRKALPTLEAGIHCRSETNDKSEVRCSPTRLATYLSVVNLS